MATTALTVNCTAIRATPLALCVPARTPAPAPGPAEPAEPTLAADQLWLSDQGDAVAPDGYFRELSEVIITLLRSKAPGRNRRKYLRRLRQFFAFRYRPGERWDAFRTESDQDSFLRIRAFLISIGFECDPIPNTLDGTCDVRHPRMAYARVALVIVRQLYSALVLTSLRQGANPANIVGWEDWSIEDRIRYAQAVGYHKYGIRSAGHRFVPRQTASPFVAIYNPYECSSRLARAIEVVCPPDPILHLNRTIRLNGLRPGDVIGASALGWTQGGLGDLIWTRNKREGQELVKLATLPRATEAWLVERFTARPHPTVPDRTFLDHIRELATQAGYKTREGARARRALRDIALFAKPGTDERYSYEGLRYWIRVAVLEGEDDVIRVASNQGMKEPSLVYFRKAAIARDVRELFESTRDEVERDRGLKAIAHKYRHRTDQTRAYADFEYLREALRDNQDIHEREDADIAADRAASPAPVRSPRLASPAAQSAWEELKGRPQ